jgi:hypothetical protein
MLDLATVQESKAALQEQQAAAVERTILRTAVVPQAILVDRKPDSRRAAAWSGPRYRCSLLCETANRKNCKTDEEGRNSHQDRQNPQCKKLVSRPVKRQVKRWIIIKR